MPKQSVFIATSLDGFIARSNGDIDWLNQIDSLSGEDYGYKEFTSTIDAMVMGRHTFEKVMSFDNWPYDLPVVVLSSRAIEIPEKFREHVLKMSGSPNDIVDRLSDEGYEHLYIDGGKTIQQFLRAGYIQKMIITRIPILIGDGIPLFGSLDKDLKLEHLSTNTFANGLVQSSYSVVHNA